jgi:hypothetical protein
MPRTNSSLDSIAIGFLLLFPFVSIWLSSQFDPLCNQSTEQAINIVCRVFGGNEYVRSNAEALYRCGIFSAHRSLRGLHLHINGGPIARASLLLHMDTDLPPSSQMDIVAPDDMGAPNADMGDPDANIVAPDDMDAPDIDRYTPTNP